MQSIKRFIPLFFISLFFISFTCYAQDLENFENEFSTPKKEIFDPLEGYNRSMTTFNDYVYTNILEPTAKGYAVVVPEPARIGISNFIYNIKFPIRFVNNILQFKLTNAVKELGRFTVNSTFGLLGFLDPASENLGMEKYDEDFGQTLGFYGIGGGFHVVLPFLGPSNLRDMVGIVGDGYVNPLNATSAMNYKIPENSEQTLGISVFKAVNNVSLNLGKYENIKKDAIDLYPFFRDTYNQKREKEIRE
ncbi:MAG: VacJ family lipoprotein [Halarcobacter sp.]